VERPVLRVTDLAKSYGSVPALSGVTLSIEPGQILSLLGPNGAGKTTLVRIIVGLTKADRGDLAVDRPVAYAPQDLGLAPPLTVRENLTLFAELAGLRWPTVEAAIDRVAGELGIGDLLHRRVNALSAGERRKAHVAAALLADNPLLVLDEPTTSLDVPSRLALLDVVRTRAAHGAAVLFSTNHLEEADALAGTVAILDRGRLVATGSVEELAAAHRPEPSMPASSRLEAAFAGVTGRPYREDEA
jgi:ABC-2 type transport system ATP-binding protein